MRPSIEISPPSLPREKANQTSDAGIKRRVRARQACEACRRRRRKCDGKLPCAQCIGYHYSCEYAGGYNEEFMDAEVLKAGHAHKTPEAAIRAASGQPDDSNCATKRGGGSSRPTFRTSDNIHAAVERGDQPIEVRSVVDAEKGRFSNVYSGILFPRRVGHAVGLSSRVRFQSYGWNLDIRPEPSPPSLPAIRRFLTYQDVSRYSRIYFDVVDPVYHFLNYDELLRRCAEYWTTDSENVNDIEAVIAGVVALGSFFSESPIADEGRLVEHAKVVLDVGCTRAPGWTSLNQTAGWILRTLYLRLTTRPLLSWYASCSIVHIAEANGLHVDLQTVDVVNSAYATPAYLVSRAALLDCGLFLNTFISAEYGRSRVVLQDATEPSTLATSPLRMLHRVLTTMEADINSAARLDLLSSLNPSPDEPHALTLLKADVAIHLFRTHLHSRHESTGFEEKRVMLSILKTALAHTQILLPLRKPWWNILSTPFQSLMVCLAMDVDESLIMAQEAMAVLASVYETFPTHLAGEVLQIAQTLVKGLEERKFRQAKLLSDIMNKVQVDARAQDYSGILSATDQATNLSEAILDDWLTNDIFGVGYPDMDVFQQPNEVLGSFDAL